MYPILACTKLALLCLAAACTARGGGDRGLAVGSLDERGDGGSSSLEMRAIAPARAASTTDGRRHLVYELAFRNAGPRRVQIARIEVFTPGRAGALHELEGEELLTMLQITNPDGTTDGIQPEGFAFAHFDLTPPVTLRTSAGLRHRITLAADDATTIRIDGPSVEVIDAPGEPLGPPLRVDNLLDLNGCCSGGHALAVLATAEGLFVAQRYAIDFVRIRGQSTFAGDPADNRSYFLYGAEVIAAEDGRIVGSRDGMPDLVPTEQLPAFDPETAAGNHLIQALPDGRFVLYAHLQSHSLRVRQGDDVRRGQVLGLVGNSGNSSEPHLHFQLMNAASALVADGLPFTFEDFRLVARAELSAASFVLAPAPQPSQRQHQLPMAWDVISFQ